MINKAQRLRQAFQEKPLLRIMGAHHGLGAKLIEKHGFDGVWASGLEISTSHVVPDANLLTMTENLEAAGAINDATTLPVICDCDTGYGNALNVAYLVKKYEARGIAAVVIEDKNFPKVNSFIPGRQDLADVEEFMGKIQAAKNAQTDPDFMVFARIEALIAGWGMDEALKRAYAYAEAGADGLVIHSKATSPDEVFEFMRNFKGKVPVVVIPTTYYKVKAEELSARGVRMVIYANQGLRASIRAMDETFRAIAETGSSESVEGSITTMKQVFEIQGMLELKDEEERFVRRESIQAVIPAAGDHRFQSDLNGVLQDRPICMIDLGGKTLVDRQMDSLRSCGAGEILVVGGYAADRLKLDGAKLLRNPDFDRKGSAHSLMLARDWVKKKCVMVYADIIFDRHILGHLMESPHDITLVIDRAYQKQPPRDKRLDLVVVADPKDASPRKLGQGFKTVQRVGRRLEGKGDHEFIGMAMFSEHGFDSLKRAWEVAHQRFKGKPFYESESVDKADLNDLIQFVIDRGEPVHGVEIEQGWSEIHSLEDYERVSSHFRQGAASVAAR